jgi:hypothetical protein
MGPIWLAAAGLLSLITLPLTIVQLQALFRFSARPIRFDHLILLWVTAVVVAPPRPAWSLRPLAELIATTRRRPSRLRSRWRTTRPRPGRPIQRTIRSSSAPSSASDAAPDGDRVAEAAPGVADRDDGRRRVVLPTALVDGPGGGAPRRHTSTRRGASPPAARFRAIPVDEVAERPGHDEASVPAEAVARLLMPMSGRSSPSG